MKKTMKGTKKRLMLRTKKRTKSKESNEATDGGWGMGNMQRGKQQGGRK
jgi:hypothetical protein